MSYNLEQFTAYKHEEAQKLTQKDGFNPHLVGMAIDKVNNFIENNLSPETVAFELKGVIGSDANQSTVNAVVEIFRNAGYTISTDNGKIIIKV